MLFGYPPSYDDLALSLLWAVPMLGALLVLLIPKAQVKAVRVTALVVTVITFGVALQVFGHYLGSGAASAPLAQRAEANPLPADAPVAARAGSADEATVAEAPSSAPADADATARIPEDDLLVRHAWIPAFRIQYYLGLDGISLSLVLLTGLVSVLACLASWNIEKQAKGYFSLFLILLGSMMGVFLALDMFLFYVFFEVMLLPMYFLIAIWGGENREYAAIKFLLYTLFGSVFILVAILLLYFWGGNGDYAVGGLQFAAHSFDAVLLAQVAGHSNYYGTGVQIWIFALFLIGFLVKLPSFPFHTWLPDAHVQAPTPISMILAGVLLKIGGYGLIRLAWPLAPAGAQYLSGFVAALAVFSIIYGALAAMAQTDFKKLVAYSSVSHMGYVTLGLAAMSMITSQRALDPRWYAYGVNGAMYMMIAHGITSTGMFFLVGVIYERAHTRDLKKLGGLMNVMPIYGAVGLVIFFGSMGLPGLCGFIAEVFVVLAAFNYSLVLAILAAVAVILTAGYVLWTIQRVYLGRNEHWRGLPDMNAREQLIAYPLVILTIWLGIFPQSLLGWMSPSVEQTIEQMANSPARRTIETEQRYGGPAPAPAATAQAPPAVRLK
jgi:NADH-quinone oxidoreductase subunit M